MLPPLGTFSSAILMAIEGTCTIFARAGVSGPAGAARIRLISNSATIAAQKAT
jgi:hypothetical protein